MRRRCVTSRSQWQNGDNRVAVIDVDANLDDGRRLRFIAWLRLLFVRQE